MGWWGESEDKSTFYSSKFWNINSELSSLTWVKCFRSDQNLAWLWVIVPPALPPGLSSTAPPGCWGWGRVSAALSLHRYLCNTYIDISVTSSRSVEVLSLECLSIHSYILPFKPAVISTHTVSCHADFCNNSCNYVNSKKQFYHT